MKLLPLVPVVVIAAAFIGQAVGNTCYSFLPMWHYCVGTTALDEGTTYTGTWEWNVATGEGTLQRTDGSSYSGDVVDGQPNGEGEETLANGDRYAGSVVDGTWSGKGVLTLVNGDTYTGDFANGQRSGTGTETTESGESYTGRFENDQRHGQGQLVRENRDIYTGEFARVDISVFTDQLTLTMALVVFKTARIAFPTLSCFCARARPLSVSKITGVGIAVDQCEHALA